MSEDKTGPPRVVNDPDPWSNRSEQMTCQTCMWYLAKNKGKKLGRCRRRAPTHDGFPAVFPRDWCGDHKLNDEAL